LPEEDKEINAGGQPRKVKQSEKNKIRICKADKRNPVEVRDGHATVIGTKPR
jgi:hypothetical protein